MPRPNPPQPTDLELDILRAVWSRGEVTTRDVVRTLEQAGRKQSANACHMAMRKMVDRGLLRVIDERRPIVYAAVIDRESTYQSLLSSLKHRFFGGSLREMINHAVGGKKASADEIAELRKVIDDMEG